jgi:hypothetical protein
LSRFRIRFVFSIQTANCLSNCGFLRRASCSTHLESVNLSSLFSILGGPKTHVKLTIEWDQGGVLFPALELVLNFPNATCRRLESAR